MQFISHLFKMIQREAIAQFNCEVKINPAIVIILAIFYVCVKSISEKEASATTHDSTGVLM